jgi:hypothetical protein
VSHVLAHLEWVLEHKRNPRFVTFQFVFVNLDKNDKPKEKRIFTQECFYYSSLAELILLSRIGIPEPLSVVEFIFEVGSTALENVSDPFFSAFHERLSYKNFTELYWLELQNFQQNYPLKVQKYLCFETE